MGHFVSWYNKIGYACICSCTRVFACLYSNFCQAPPLRHSDECLLQRQSLGLDSVDNGKSNNTVAYLQSLHLNGTQITNSIWRLTRWLAQKHRHAAYGQQREIVVDKVRQDQHKMASNKITNWYTSGSASHLNTNFHFDIFHTYTQTPKHPSISAFSLPQSNPSHLHQGR